MATPLPSFVPDDSLDPPDTPLDPVPVQPEEDALSPTVAPILHDVDIPITPGLLYQLGRRTQQEDVEVGGVYDDKIAAIAVYDRPWASPQDPGNARILGVIYLSTRTNRVYRIEVNPETGATRDDLLDHLRHLIEPEE